MFPIFCMIPSHFKIEIFINTSRIRHIWPWSIKSYSAPSLKCLLDFPLIFDPLLLLHHPSTCLFYMLPHASTIPCSLPSRIYPLFSICPTLIVSETLSFPILCTPIYPKIISRSPQLMSPIFEKSLNNTELNMHIRETWRHRIKIKQNSMEWKYLTKMLMHRNRFQFDYLKLVCKIPWLTQNIDNSKKEIQYLIYEELEQFRFF